MSNVSAKNQNRSVSQFGSVIKRFSRNKMAVAGLIILVTLMIIFLTAPLYLSYDRAISQDISNRLQKPTLTNIFGTDNFGRDVFTRIVYGGRISLFVGLGSTLLGLVIGLVWGGVLRSMSRLRA